MRPSPVSRSSAGDRLIAEAKLKQRFRDAHERRAYARAVETAKRLVNDPGLIERDTGDGRMATV
jgi:hypothetical protein